MTLHAFTHEAVGLAIYIDGTVERFLYTAPVCDAAVVEMVILAPEAEVRIDGDKRHGRESQCVLMDWGEKLCVLCTACQGEKAEQGCQQSFHKAKINVLWKLFGLMNPMGLTGLKLFCVGNWPVQSDS